MPKRLNKIEIAKRRRDVVRAYLTGASIPEISEMLKVPRSTVGDDLRASHRLIEKEFEEIENATRKTVKDFVWLSDWQRREGMRIYVEQKEVAVRDEEGNPVVEEDGTLLMKKKKLPASIRLSALKFLSEIEEKKINLLQTVGFVRKEPEVSVVSLSDEEAALKALSQIEEPFSPPPAPEKDKLKLNEQKKIEPESAEEEDEQGSN